MRLRNMLKICLVFWKSEPQYAYKLYAYKKKTCMAGAIGFLIGTCSLASPDIKLRL